MVGKLEVPGSHYLACSLFLRGEREVFAQTQGKARLIAQQQPGREDKVGS